MLCGAVYKLLYEHVSYVGEVILMNAPNWVRVRVRDCKGTKAFGCLRPLQYFLMKNPLGVKK